MRKSEIPLVGKPIYYYISCLMCSVGYILLLVFVPDVRPGLLETFIGIVIGLIDGVIISTAWVKYLITLVEQSEAKPWVGWAATVAYPLPPFGSAIKYRIIILVTMMLTFFGSAFVLERIAHRWPHIPWPYARFMLGSGSSDSLSAAFESQTPIMVMCFVIVVLSAGLNSLRWYKRLPD